MDFRKALRDVFGGGLDISAANPLPVDISPGNKTAATIITLANLAAATVSTLVDCAAVDLRSGPNTLALTIKARYNVAATQGIRVHVRTSPTNSAAGTHTAANHLTIMTDAAAHFIAGELVGLTILNVTTGASAVITANTETTVTVAAIAGGWTTGNAYSIAGADFDVADWDTWTPAFAANTVLRQTKHYDTHPMYVKVLVENLDPAVAVTDIRVISTRGV